MEEAEYIIKESRRAKDISITVDIDGLVYITKPLFMPQILVDQFVFKKQSWINRNVGYFKSFKYDPDFDFRRVKRFTKKDYLKNKEKARSLIKERIEYFNSFYGLSLKRIAIRNHKSCWGTCSENGNLNFNYRLLFLPPHLRDYVIVHELCHLQEFNHSPRFWSLVERACPDYKNLRKELKKKELFYQ